MALDTNEALSRRRGLERVLDGLTVVATAVGVVTLSLGWIAVLVRTAQWLVRG